MKTPLKTAVALLAVLLLFMATTEPAKLPLLLLIIPFILLYALVIAALAVTTGIAGKPVTVKHIRRYAGWTALPMLLLVLQSTGQLTFKDAGIIILLFILGYFYMAHNGKLARD